MKYFLLTILLLSTIITTPAMSQVEGKERIFRQVPLYELEMKEYKADPGAEAVILFDIGISSFVEGASGFDVIFERITRIKILDDAGLRFAEVEIPLYQEGNIIEKVYKIEGYTYNQVDGQTQKTSLNPNSTYTEKINQYWINEKFVMPNVKKGSVIEYRYTIESQYISQLRDWEFQNSAPTIFSEYVTYMIPFYSYSWVLQGADGFSSYSVFEDKGVSRSFGGIPFHDNIHSFVMKDIPAFKDEEFINSRNDYIIKLDLQLEKVIDVRGFTRNIRSTWPELIKSLDKSEYFGKYLSKCESYTKKNELVADALQLPEIDRVKFITNSIKSTFSWDGILGYNAVKSVREFTDSKLGSVAEINLFLIGALRSSGLEAYPVIMSTRTNGKIKSDYPFLHFFNYVIAIVKVGSGYILLDATEPLLTYDHLPTRCINDKGLIINTGQEDWVTVSYGQPSTETTSINIIINEDISQLEAKLMISSNDYAALLNRKIILGNPSAMEEKFRAAGYSFKESDLVLNNPGDPTNEFTVDAEVTLPSENINGKIYISPFLSEPIKENPLKQDRRVLPVDFTYPVTKTYISTIKIPDGYEPDYIPQDKKYSNGNYELDFSTNISSDKVEVKLSYSLKQASYPASYYNRLKAFYNDVISLGSEKIVYRKIETSPDIQ